jgi:hypothetical protein
MMVPREFLTDENKKGPVSCRCDVVAGGLIERLQQKGSIAGELDRAGLRDQFGI